MRIKKHFKNLFVVILFASCSTKDKKDNIALAFLINQSSTSSNHSKKTEKKQPLPKLN